MNGQLLSKSCIQRKLITYLLELSFSFSLTYLLHDLLRALQLYHHSKQMLADPGLLPAPKC